MFSPRSVLFVLPALAALLVVPSWASPGPTVHRADYVATGLAVAQGRWVGERCGTSCVHFTVARGIKRLSIEVADTSGRAVGWAAHQGTHGAGQGCGTGSLRVLPGQDIWVTATADAACAVVPTTGTVKVTETSK